MSFTSSSGSATLVENTPQQKTIMSLFEDQGSVFIFNLQGNLPLQT